VKRSQRTPALLGDILRAEFGYRAVDGAKGDVEERNKGQRRREVRVPAGGPHLPTRMDAVDQAQDGRDAGAQDQQNAMPQLRTHGSLLTGGGRRDTVSVREDLDRANAL